LIINYLQTNKNDLQNKNVKNKSQRDHLKKASVVERLRRFFC